MHLHIIKLVWLNKLLCCVIILVYTNLNCDVHTLLDLTLQTK